MLIISTTAPRWAVSTLSQLMCDCTKGRYDIHVAGSYGMAVIVWRQYCGGHWRIGKTLSLFVIILQSQHAITGMEGEREERERNGREGRRKRGITKGRRGSDGKGKGY